MKTINTIILAGLMIFSACKKEDKGIILNTDIRVINAAVGTAVKVDPGRNIVYSKTTPVSFGGSRLYMLERTSVPFKIVNAVDTTALLYDGTLNLTLPLYTIYVTGQAPAFETILKEETDFPFFNPVDNIVVKADSVVNVRFINLSPNSVPVKIKIATATGNEVDNLPYKGFGNWRKYTATASSTVYAFQIRDAITDALLTTFNFTATATNRFKNVSLIIKGLQGTTTGTNAFGIMTVNHF